MLSGFTAVSSNDFTQLYRRLVGCRVVIWIWFLSIFAATVIILPLGYLTFDLHSETKKWTEISLISCWKMFRWRTNTFFLFWSFSPHIFHRQLRIWTKNHHLWYALWRRLNATTEWARTKCLLFSLSFRLLLPPFESTNGEAYARRKPM